MNKPIAKIDINNIFFQLHEIASQQANSGKVEVTNLGVDPDKKTFTGPGEMLLVACAKESGDIDDNLKKNCLVALQTYVEFFASKDVSSKIKEEDLTPIERKTDKKDKTKKKKEESAEWKSSLLSKIFEDVDDNVDGEIVGYSLPYKMNIEGQKDIDLQASFKKLAAKAGGFVGDVLSGILSGTMTVGKELLKGMFGSTLSDLASIKFHTFGNHSVGVKDIVDPAIGLSKGIAKVFKDKVVPFLKDNFLDKDIKDVQQKLQARLSEKYPNTTAKVSIEKKNALLTDLKTHNKLDTDVKKTLSDTNLDQVLVIEVNSNDKNYGMFSVEAIAKHLAYVVGGMLGKLKLWDNDKDKAKVFNLLSKSYKISKVSDYDSNKSDISISKEQASKKESLDNTIKMMKLVFENIDEESIKLIFDEANKDDMLKDKEKECLELFNKIVKSMQTKEDIAISKFYLKDFIKQFEDYVASKGDKSGAFRNSQGRFTVRYKTFVQRLEDLSVQEADVNSDDLKTAFKELMYTTLDKSNAKTIDSSKQLEMLDSIADAIKHISLKVQPKKSNNESKDLYIITKPKSWYQGFDREEKSKDSKEEKK